MAREHASPTAKATELSPLVAHSPQLVSQRKPAVLPTPIAPPSPRQTLQLEHYRRWSATSALLAGVSHVTVNGSCERGGVTYYIVDIFISPPSSRLPTNDANASPSHPHDRMATQDQPMLLLRQVERRYSEFERLRHQIIALVGTVPMCDCSYCSKLRSFLRSVRNQPGVLSKLSTDISRRRTMLDAFLTRLLELAQAPAIGFEHRDGHHGNRERVHSAMQTFLLGSEHNSTANERMN